MSNFDEDEGQTAVEVKKHGGVKCPRCWLMHNFVHNYQWLCDRCVTVMIENYKEHCETPNIIKVRDWQVDMYSDPGRICVDWQQLLSEFRTQHPNKSTYEEWLVFLTDKRLR